MNKLFMTTAALIIALNSGPLIADTTRGCKATWEVRVGAAPPRTFGLFDSRGRCRGKAWANDCRRQARTFAQQCFWDHWARRNSPEIKSGAQKPPHYLGRGDIGVRNYSVTDVKQALEREACAMHISPPFTVVVVGRTFDGKRCDGEVVLTGTNEIRDKMCGKQ